MGGAERVIAQLSNQFVENGLKVEILTIENRNDFENKISKQVEIKCINKNRIISTVLPVFNYLKNSDSNFFATNIWPLTLISSILSIFFKEKKFIAIEHCNIFTEFKYKGIFFVSFQKLSVFLFYWLNHQIIAVSEGVKDSLIRCNPFLKNKIKVIYNPTRADVIKNVHISDQEYKEFSDFNHHRIISVGSLNQQKNYPHLLRSLKKIKTNGIKFLCYIIGEGTLLNDTNRLIRELNLSDSVKCIGYKSDPREYIQLADVFVLSSLAEGFGLVIVEAMQCGVTPVSSNCPSGPAEIIENDYGYLTTVNDDDELSKKIIYALSNKVPPNLLKKRASFFNEQRVSLAYINLFKNFK